MEISEKDWKLFLSLIPEWQEAYMEKMNRSYTEILTADDLEASEKFHSLREKINKDYNSPGVFVERKRSKLIENLTRLVRDGVITFDDLSGFSEELRDTVGFWVDYDKN